MLEYELLFVHDTERRCPLFHNIIIIIIYYALQLLHTVYTTSTISLAIIIMLSLGIYITVSWTSLLYSIYNIIGRAGASPTTRKYIRVAQRRPNYYTIVSCSPLAPLAHDEGFCVCRCFVVFLPTGIRWVPWLRVSPVFNGPIYSAQQRGGACIHRITRVTAAAV